jgi:hypothetical protein
MVYALPCKQDTQTKESKMKNQILTPQIESLISDFIEVLNTQATNICYDEYRVEYGRKLAKVWGYNKGSVQSVHCFIDFTNGDVIKAATYKAPQKNSDGTYSVRYNLLDPISRADLFAKAEFTGGYLYKK